MDEPQSHDASAEPWRDTFDQALAQQRARVAEFVAAQRTRIIEAETQIESRFDALVEALDAEQNETSALRAEFESQQQALRDQAAQLAQFKRDLDAQQAALSEAQTSASRQQELLAAQLAAREDKLTEQSVQLAKATAELRDERTQLQDALQDLEAGRAELGRQKKRLAEKQAELDEHQERIDELDSQTRNQRRRIARELREQKLTALEEIERQREKLDEVAAAAESELHARLTSMAREMDQLRQQSARDRDELAQTTSALDSLRNRDAELESELAAALRSVTDFEQHHALAESEADAEQGEVDVHGPLHRELDFLREQSERLTQELATAREAASAAEHLAAQRAAECETQRAAAEEAQRVAAEAPAAADSTELSDMRRRYELAMEDVRDLKAEKQELEARLRTAPRSSGSGPLPPAEAMDWESQKRRLLAALESDFDEDDPRDKAERLRVEDAIRRTDQVVADKDVLIAQLQEQISREAARPAIDPAVAAAVDADDVVKNERQRLEQLRASWEEKLRQAEIDLSVERAKIGRQRAELEEKLRDLEANRQAASAPGAPPATPERPQRGRWLARLGLRDDESNG